MTAAAFGFVPALQATRLSPNESLKEGGRSETAGSQGRRLRSALVVSEKTTTVWELADMLASRQPKKALEFLDRLLRDGEEPLPMLGAMTWMYRKLIEASEIKGVANGWQAARALGMRPEQAELALQNARKISKGRLFSGLRALQKADDRLKGGGEDARAVMEFLVTELTSAEAKAARG